MHVAWSIALALCAVGAKYAAAREPSTRALPADRSLELISNEHVRTPPADGGPKLMSGGVPSVRLVVLPLPVPVPVPPSKAAECTPSAPAATANSSEFEYITKFEIIRPTSYTAETTENYFPVPPHPSAAPSASPPPPHTVPHFPAVEDSRLLVEKFRAETPTHPELPPVGIPPYLNEDEDDPFIQKNTENEFPSSDVRRLLAQPNLRSVRKGWRCQRPCYRRPAPGVKPYYTLPNIESGQRDRSPEPRAPPLLFYQSLKLRARLTVPRADYTEPYTVWWDQRSGASRIDFHGGTATTYRSWRPDGLLQSVLVREDRTDHVDVRRCVVALAQSKTLRERELPALPDVRYFSFDGYVADTNNRLEIWRYKLAGRSGELGAVRGEALTFHHELLVSRAADNYTAVPVRYSVRVDSSVLGDNCDGYVHTYTQVTPAVHDPVTLQLDIAEACETVQTTELLELVEPLCEFTMLHRDPRYDDAFERYKEQHARKYRDDTEEAVRKILLIQSHRFTESGNRQGATFQLDINFGSDRLREEWNMLQGAKQTGSLKHILQDFPYAEEKLKKLKKDLPASFDWRERGVVTPVRNQALCPACWAFSVVGAVESALARKTNRLVELSEQSLVDCTKPRSSSHPEPNCERLWPYDGFEYVHQYGLPSRPDYPYEAKKQVCGAHSWPSVTRIKAYVKVPKNINALKVAIRKYGPTVVVVDGGQSSFKDYSKGYYYDGGCNTDNPTHALLAVGWTEFRGHTYFILKNSWGDVWGEGGYIKVQGEANICGVFQHASYPLLFDTNVQHMPANATVVQRARRRGAAPP